MEFFNIILKDLILDVVILYTIFPHVIQFILNKINDDEFEILNIDEIRKFIFYYYFKYWFMVSLVINYLTYLKKHV
jgi:hypothetical protein